MVDIGRMASAGGRGLRRGWRGAALDVGHAEVRQPIVNADFMDGRDMGVVVEAGVGANLFAEAGEVFGRGEVAAEDHLEGDEAIEAALSRLVNDTHAAAADFFEQFVVADASLNNKGTFMFSWV
jgi:hypothetical protein